MVKNWLKVGLLLVLLASGIIYVQLPRNVKIRVDEDKTTLYVYDHDAHFWRVTGREYNSLWDGTSKMNRRASLIVVNQTIDNVANTMTVWRTTPYIRGPSIKDTYFFDGRNGNVNFFPVYHTVEIFNGKGFIYQYEVQDLYYHRNTTYLLDRQKQCFPYKTCVEWEEGNYYAKVYKYVNNDRGKLTIKYRLDEDYENFSVRLFDATIDSSCNLVDASWWNCTGAITGNTMDVAENIWIHDATITGEAEMRINTTGSWINITDSTISYSGGTGAISSVKVYAPNGVIKINKSSLLSQGGLSPSASSGRPGTVGLYANEIILYDNVTLSGKGGLCTQANQPGGSGIVTLESDNNITAGNYFYFIARQGNGNTASAALTTFRFSGALTFGDNAKCNGCCNSDSVPSDSNNGNSCRTIFYGGKTIDIGDSFYLNMFGSQGDNFMGYSWITMNTTDYITIGAKAILNVGDATTSTVSRHWYKTGYRIDFQNGSKLTVFDTHYVNLTDEAVFFGMTNTTVSAATTVHHDNDVDMLVGIKSATEFDNDWSMGTYHNWTYDRYFNNTLRQVEDLDVADFDTGSPLWIGYDATPFLNWSLDNPGFCRLENTSSDKSYGQISSDYESTYDESAYYHNYTVPATQILPYNTYQRFCVACKTYLEDENTTGCTYELNLSYQSISNPLTALQTPADSFHNESVTSANTFFNCSAVAYNGDGIFNMSLYLWYSADNVTAFTGGENQTCTFSAPYVNSSCNWTADLPLGHYRWNCLAYDNKSINSDYNSDWGDVNRSLIISHNCSPQIYLDGVADTDRFYELLMRPNITVTTQCGSYYSCTASFAGSNMTSYSWLAESINTTTRKISIARETDFNGSANKNITTDEYIYIESANRTFAACGANISQGNATATSNVYIYQNGSLIQELKGNLVGDNIEVTEHVYAGAVANKSTLIYGAAGTDTIYLNISTSGLLDKAGEVYGILNFSMWGVETDVNNAVDETEFFENSSVSYGNITYSTTSWSTWEDFETDKSERWTWVNQTGITSSFTPSYSWTTTGDGYAQVAMSSSTTGQLTNGFSTHIEPDDIYINLSEIGRVDIKVYLSASCSISAKSASATVYVYIANGTIERTAYSRTCGCVGPDDSCSNSNTYNISFRRVLDTQNIYVYVNDVYQTNIGIGDLTAPVIRFKVNNYLSNNGDWYVSSSGAIRVYNINSSGIMTDLNAGVYDLSGNFTSERVNITTDNITAVTLTAVDYKPGGTNITYYVSNDNGTTFEEAISGTSNVFSSEGNELKYRVVIGNNNSLYSGHVQNVRLQIIPGAPQEVKVSVGDAFDIQTVAYELNTSTSPVYFTGNDTGILSYINTSCRTAQTCLVPVRYELNSSGALIVNETAYTYNPNPIVFNSSNFDNDIELLDILTTFSSGRVFYDDLRCDYYGNGNITVNVNCTDDNSQSDSQIMVMRYTNFDIGYPIGITIYDLFFEDYYYYTAWSSINPYGQRIHSEWENLSIPIWNWSIDRHVEHNANCTTWLNQSLNNSCIKVRSCPYSNSTECYEINTTSYSHMFQTGKTGADQWNDFHFWNLTSCAFVNDTIYWYTPNFYTACYCEECVVTTLI